MSRSLVAIILLSAWPASTAVAAQGAPASTSRHPGWKTYKGPHITLYYSPDSALAKPGAIEQYAGERERVRDDICNRIGIRHGKRIYFFVYDNNDVAYRLIGRNAGFAQATDAIIHARITQTPGHEMTHVLSRAITGRPPPNRVLDEGLAVYMDHSGRDYFAIAADLLNARELPSFAQMLTASRRRKTEEWYHPAGAFIGFLCERYGFDKFKALWAAPSESFYPTFTRIYGKRATDVEEEWRAFLNQNSMLPQWHARGWSGRLWDVDISADFQMKSISARAWKMANEYAGWGHARVMAENLELKVGGMRLRIQSPAGCTVGLCSSDGRDANVYVNLPPSQNWQALVFSPRGRTTIDGVSVSVQVYGSAPDVHRPFIALKRGTSIQVAFDGLQP